MPQKIWRLTVRSDFSSAHSLRHYEGKCEAVHGHNFAVEMVVEGATLVQDTEILVDFKLLKDVLNGVLDHLDHKDLSTVPPFDQQNPSSENLARHIYKELRPLVEQGPVTLYSVSVSEKPAQTATYMER